MRKYVLSMLNNIRDLICPFIDLVFLLSVFYNNDQTIFTSFWLLPRLSRFLNDAKTVEKPRATDCRVSCSSYQWLGFLSSCPAEWRRHADQQVDGKDGGLAAPMETHRVLWLWGGVDGGKVWEEKLKVKGTKGCVNLNKGNFVDE